MGLHENFENTISKLSNKELIKIASNGILANVYYTDNYIYCFTYRDFDSVTYVITDNGVELSNFIYNHLLGNFTSNSGIFNDKIVFTDNIMIFPMNRDDCDRYDSMSQFPTSYQTFRCYPNNPNNWCNRSIKNKKSFIDWMIARDPIEKDKIDDAIRDDWRYYATATDINEYIKYLFGVSKIEWYPIS